MIFNRHKHHRRSIRLAGYDYSQPGAYFVTVCTYGRECLFGAVAAGAVQLSDCGVVASEEWLRTARLRPEIELDVFVVMPNHLHGIVIIKGDEERVGAEDANVGAQGVGATGRSPLHDTEGRPRGPAKRSLASFICGYKPAVTRRINQLRDSPAAPVWQRNYYERVIRNDEELARARAYISHNPMRWADDDYYMET